MFKDILVPMILGELPEAAVSAACTIARVFDAHVDALVGISMITPNAAAWSYYPEGLYATLKESAEATLDEMAAAAEKRLAREDATHEVRRCSSIWLTTNEMTVACAHHVDLVVLGRGVEANDAERRLFGGLLAGSGRPLLLVPEGTPASWSIGHAVVAWKTSREAARALHDALPLLQRATSVDVLQVAEAPDETRDDTLARVDRHLRRHGIEPRLVRVERSERSSAAEILDHAGNSRADLVVAGGYSHSRAREQVFGGVTLSLLESATRPVLFSH